MGIGLGILLLVVGAIIAFTRYDTQLTGTNLDIVGWILMGGGVLSLVFGTMQNRQRANTSHTSVVERRNIDEGNVEHRVVEERRTDDPL